MTSRLNTFLIVTPAKAGVQGHYHPAEHLALDSGVRRNDVHFLSAVKA